MVIAVAHLLLAATWLGSMAYSLLVVQPRVARFFTDESSQEDFLLALAHGNRWPVMGLVGAILLTAAGVLITWPRVAVGYAVALVLYSTAAALFVHVSWRHWPARVFALPHELGSYRRRLRILAWAMFVLVGTAFLVAVSVSVGARA